MKVWKRIILKEGVVLGLILLLSMGMTTFAAQTTTSFKYSGKTVNCELNVSWKTGKDTGKSRTYVSGGSGKYPLGAYCNAYKNGTLLGGNHVTSFDDASVSIRYTADKFRSVHNIQNAGRVPLSSTKLSLTN